MANIGNMLSSSNINVINDIINKEDIKFSLELMGIVKGDVLIVHSSLSSIGYVDGGADSVIDALLETVGDEGTIVMSTLTGWFDHFDADTSPSAVGKISEVFRKRNNAYRSLHPVHSVAAIGKHAKYITDGHNNCETGCGQGTPYYKIKELNGKIMLLGVDMDRNTIMHCLEEEIDAHYLRTLDIVAPTYIENYKEKIFILKKFPPGHRDFLRITPELRKKDALIEGKIGNAIVKVIDMEKLFNMGLEILKNDPLFFICSNPNCNSCDWSRLLYSDTDIDYTRYRGNGCVDNTCEICVVD
ncbi:MAG TPA: AAC(3) family N-acetyltransferase [Clostridiales bacterium]|nr:AAC(3) family N-acetyltransferase [Clostridiales bacterium]